MKTKNHQDVQNKITNYTYLNNSKNRNLLHSPVILSFLSRYPPLKQVSQHIHRTAFTISTTYWPYGASR